MSVPAVLIRISTGEIIKHDTLPVDPSQEVPGLDPDLKWLIKYTPFAVPSYDSRIFLLIVNEEVTATPHPDYGLYDQYLITYNTQKRSNEEIQQEVENAESLANESLLPYEKRVKLLTLAVGVLIRKTNGVSLTPKEQVIEDLMIATAVRVWKNDTEAKNKIDQILNNIEPEIDAGWESDQ